MRAKIVALTVAVASIVGQDALSEPPGGHHTPPPPIELPDFPDFPLLPTEPVGYVDGSSRVTPNGEFTYTIPIEVPAGRAGMQPEISLQYSSRTGVRRAS